MTSLHDEMREGRERRGITLDALHAATRISREALDAIERGEFEFLPKTYVRLFLRTYAAHVGMDPQYVLDRYEELVVPPPGDAPASIPQPRPIPWARIVALTIGFFLLGWAGITAFKNRAGDQYPPGLAVGRPAFTPGTPQASAGPGESAELPQGRAERPSPADSAVPAGSGPIAGTLPDSSVGTPEFQNPAWWASDSLVVLKGVCVEQTWLDVSTDGLRAFRGEMNPGEERAWTARDRFYVVAGRSSGIQFSLQGKPLIRARSWASEVLRMAITRKGIEVEKRRRPAGPTEDSAASQRTGTVSDTGQ